MTLSRRSAIWLGIWLAATVAAAIAFLRWGNSQELVTQSTARMTTKTPLRDLWFAPSGDLIGVEQNGWRLRIWTWYPQTGVARSTRVIDLAELTRRARSPADPKSVGSPRSHLDPSQRLPASKADTFSFAGQSNSLLGDGSPIGFRKAGLPAAKRPLTVLNPAYQSTPHVREVSVSDPPPPFALTRDANDLAWAWSDQVLLSRSKEPSGTGTPLSLGLGSGQPVSGLAYTREGLLGAVYGDGHVEVWNPLTNEVDSADGESGQGEHQSSASGGWMIRTFGPYVATFSFPGSSAAVFDSRGNLEMSHQHYEIGRPNGTALALSPSGRPAVGTADGNVLLPLPRQAGGSLDLVRDTPGPVRALAFSGDGLLLVAGDFRGISAIATRPGFSSGEVAPAPVGTSLLAVKEHGLASVSGKNVSLFRHSLARSITQTGVVTLASWSLLTIALGAAALFQRMVNRRAVKKSERPSSPDLQPPVVARVAQPARSTRDVSGESLPLPDPPQALIDAIGRGECVLYAGTGLSAQGGLPTRSALLENLVRLGRERGLIPEDRAADLIRSLAAGHREDAADEIAELIPRDVLREEIRSQMAPGRLSAAHKMLADLPFAGVLTTNFDDLLSVAFAKRNPPVFTPSEIEPLLNSLREKAFFILHLQGRLDDSMLFTLKEYRDATAKNLAFRQFMQTLFVRNNLFFVGTHVQGIRDYLTSLDLASIKPDREHFAIVGRSTELDGVQMRSLKRNFGVNVLGFRPRPGYPEIKEFLQKIRLGVIGFQGPAAGPSRMVLERVVLNNIGPFEHLDVTLTDSWNVILGDNGVGKSAVLRAIAAALCGEDADEAAVTRLLRSGSESGTIELYVGTACYSVQIQRAGGRVHIASASLSPLKLSNWLVLGFPPLRTMSWDRPKGPSPDPQKRPSPADLLPILAGKPDTRLNDIKQRLINLDYRATGSSAAAQGAARLFDRFFYVLDEVTTGMKLKFHSINKETYEILLETDTGIVPIESISQGTVSIMGWVGLLLERLYDIHGSLPNPEEAGALVLVDEIDAHMHPAWQRSVVPALRKLFPHVQVIASTHSALIVAGMNTEEVLLARRDDAGRSVLEHPGVDLKGMRADQILTAPIFGLDGTRDPATQEKIARYTALSAADELSPADQGELAKLAGELEVQLPSAAEKGEARDAFALLQDSLIERMEKMPPERQRVLLEEVKVQLQETVTGSRRPE